MGPQQHVIQSDPHVQFNKEQVFRCTAALYYYCREPWWLKQKVLFSHWLESSCIAAMQEYHAPILFELYRGWVGPHHNDPEGGCQEVNSDKRLCKEENEMDRGLQ